MVFGQQDNNKGFCGLMLSCPEGSGKKKNYSDIQGYVILDAKKNTGYLR